jgi:diketogulonate reductase-like aldo/keto reductase
LRWGIDRGFAVIPKSTKKDHTQSNIDIGDFTLDQEEIKQINALNIMFKTDWDPKDEA